MRFLSPSSPHRSYYGGGSLSSPTARTERVRAQFATLHTDTLRRIQIAHPTRLEMPNKNIPRNFGEPLQRAELRASEMGQVTRVRFGGGGAKGTPGGSLKKVAPGVSNIAFFNIMTGFGCLAPSSSKLRPGSISYTAKMGQ